MFGFYFQFNNIQGNVFLALQIGDPEHEVKIGNQEAEAFKEKVQVKISRGGDPGTRYSSHGRSVNKSYFSSSSWNCGPPLIMERAGLTEPGFWPAPTTDLKIPSCSNNTNQLPGCLVLVLYPTDLAKLWAFRTSGVSINSHLRPMISMMALITMSS